MRSSGFYDGHTGQRLDLERQEAEEVERQRVELFSWSEKDEQYRVALLGHTARRLKTERDRLMVELDGQRRDIAKQRARNVEDLVAQHEARRTAQALVDNARSRARVGTEIAWAAGTAPARRRGKGTGTIRHASRRVLRG